MAGRRKLFDPASTAPYPLSRTGIDAYMKCPRCFWLQKRHGVKPPGIPALSLNKAVDTLLKREFDEHRRKGTTPPMLDAGSRLVPFKHPLIDEWRSSFKGITFLHRPSTFVVSGAIDDVCWDGRGELTVVEFKATAGSGEITLDTEYRRSYKRQAEVYNWLLRMNEFSVSDTALFLFAHADATAPSLDGKLVFDIVVLRHLCDTKWIEPTLMKIRDCLMDDEIPCPSPDCELCGYVEAANGIIKKGCRS
jgi:hypothetical protein